MQLQNKSLIGLEIKNYYYSIYAYSPLMLIDEYYTSIGGLIGLWNGLSITDLSYKFYFSTQSVLTRLFVGNTKCKLWLIFFEKLKSKSKVKKIILIFFIKHLCNFL